LEKRRSVLADTRLHDRPARRRASCTVCGMSALADSGAVPNVHVRNPHKHVIQSHQSVSCVSCHARVRITVCKLFTFHHTAQSAVHNYRRLLPCGQQVCNMTTIHTNSPLLHVLQTGSTLLAMLLNAACCISNCSRPRRASLKYCTCKESSPPPKPQLVTLYPMLVSLSKFMGDTYRSTNSISLGVTVTGATENSEISGGFPFNSHGLAPTACCVS
jgi:hypothetical protein